MEQIINGKMHESAPCRCMLFVLWWLLLTTFSGAAEVPLLRWTAADMIPAGGNVSLLEFSSFGMGKYPFIPAFPGPVVRVRIDGVPLHGCSPFGPDLGCIPAAFVDSLKKSEEAGTLDFVTRNIESAEPVTETDFALGLRQKFHFQAYFNRHVGKSGTLFIGGASNGIHGSEDTGATSFRSYLMKYRRSLADSGSIVFSARMLMDRDGLEDIEKQKWMGSRETGYTALSLGVNDLPLTGRTVVSPLFYFQSGASYFRRYGVRKSLDDDSFGVSVSSSTQLGNSTITTHISSDSRAIDSRLHDRSWTYNDSRVSLTWMRNGNRYRSKLQGGMVRSSKYGTGGNGEAEFAFIIGPSLEWSVRGGVFEDSPDYGTAIYPSLEFSDSLFVSRLDMWRTKGFESGFTIKHKGVTAGLYGFRYNGKMPVFEPEKFLSAMSNNGVYSGVRFKAATGTEDHSIADVTVHYTGSSDGADVWPYPRFDLVAHGQVSKKILKEKLLTSFFGKVHVSEWVDGPLKPDGTVFFLDCGMSFEVLSLKMFYVIENIAGQEMKWFDAMGCDGRNSMWGIRWVLRN
ncbi:hypothetical protein LLG96_19950 [bacterium]|nr:hypothetical protein [bacterium]